MSCGLLCRLPAWWRTTGRSGTPLPPGGSAVPAGRARNFVELSVKSTKAATDPIVSVDSLWKVFGDHPEQTLDAGEAADGWPDQ